MEINPRLESIIKQYEEISSFNVNKPIDVGGFKGSEYLNKAFRDVNLAFKNELANETKFLRQLTVIQAQAIQLREIKSKIRELTSISKTISIFLEKLKVFVAEQCTNYIDDIEKNINILLQDSCKDNLELHNLLTGDHAQTYLQIRDQASEKEEKAVVANFDDLLYKKTSHQREIENLVFLENRILYYKRQAKFKKNALSYQLQRCREAKNHLQNIEQAINYNLAINKTNFSDYGDYELKNIYHAILQSDYKKVRLEEESGSKPRGFYISFIRSWIDSLMKVKVEERY